MKKFVLFAKRFVSDEYGVTAIEYGLLAGLIALALAVGAGLAGTALNDMFDAIGTYLTGQTGNLP